MEVNTAYKLGRVYSHLGCTLLGVVMKDSIDQVKKGWMMYSNMSGAIS